jgi:hypothetical protein
MNIALSKPQAISIIKILFTTIFVAVCCLSVKAIYDLASYFDVFPIWFVPSFSVVVLVLNAICLYLVLQVWKIENNRHASSGGGPTLLWLLMTVSFICTTAVHGFYPFHHDFLLKLANITDVLKINYGIAIFGLVVSAILTVLYTFTKMKTSAIAGLMVMALFILIPNDDCANPFNYWWINTIGASPLMYAPNLYAILLVTSGLFNIHSRIVTLLTLCVCIGTLILGLGHQLNIIW